MFYNVMFLLIFILINNSNGKTINEPSRCCVPKQFSSVMSTSSGVVLPDGKPAGTFGIYNFSYDAVKGMVGMKGISYSPFDKTKSNLWIIERINDGQVFTFDQDSKQCFKSNLPIRPLDCIPETATFLRSVMTGYGNKQILADVWLVNIDQAISYSTVSRDGLCVPINGNTFLQNPAVSTAVSTSDFVPKILDPTIFDIPDECQHLF